jgi:cyclohexanone monooxygenase
MLDEQSKHLAYVLAHAQRNDITLVEASQEAEDSWVQTIIDMAQYNVKFLEACTPGYYNNEGRPADRTVRNGSYGAGSPAFIRLLEQWREAGDLAGLELDR